MKPSTCVASALQLTKQFAVDLLPTHVLTQSWEPMLTFQERECIDLGCLLGHLFVIWHWLRKSTFTLPELLPLTANSRGKHAPVYRAFGGYHLLVRRFSACWQGVPWGMQLTNGAAGPHDAVVILSFKVILGNCIKMRSMVL